MCNFCTDVNVYIRSKHLIHGNVKIVDKLDEFDIYWLMNESSFIKTFYQTR